MFSFKKLDVYARNLIVLWFGCFLAGCSFTLVMPFLPRFIASLGVTENLYTWSGLTFAASFAASSIMSPIWGNMADRYGRKPMIIRSGVAISLVYLLMSLVTNPYELFALRIANGAFAGFIPSSMALMATNLPDHMVGRGLALISTATAAGGITGPMLGGILADIFSIRTTMQSGAMMMVIATILVVAVVKEKVNSLESKKTSPLQDLRLAIAHPQLRALLVSTMMVTASVQSMEPLLTAFVPTLQQSSLLSLLVESVTGRADASAFVSGFVYGLPAMAMVLFAARWSRLGDRIGYTRVLTIGLLGASLLALPQSLVTTAGGLIVLRFLYGTMTSAIHPSTNATLAGLVHTSFRGRAFGINSSAQYLGIVIGASAGGLIADWFGTRSVFLFTGTLLMIACIWVYMNLARSTAPFVPAGTPRSTAV